ncbi:unnamed protein product [Schistocephalus solidus]|uniref:Major facilitator superfamily (MFS) profile domain-containing protein n=1 Tax=Schistocephalus solidus TaxID=70667 RepID=A0A3P7F6P2_SCHSO|nr:unnamed protein product [Schistocephalus solidus]
MVLGIFFWGYMFTQFLGGLLSDMFGGQLVILSSTFVWGIVTLSFTMLPLASTEHDGTFHFFLISRFFLGFFQGESSESFPLFLPNGGIGYQVPWRRSWQHCPPHLCLWF